MIKVSDVLPANRLTPNKLGSSQIPRQPQIVKPLKNDTVSLSPRSQVAFRTERLGCRLTAASKNPNLSNEDKKGISTDFDTLKELLFKKDAAKQTFLDKNLSNYNAKNIKELGELIQQENYKDASFKVTYLHRAVVGYKPASYSNYRTVGFSGKTEDPAAEAKDKTFDLALKLEAASKLPEALPPGGDEKAGIDADWTVLKQIFSKKGIFSANVIKGLDTLISGAETPEDYDFAFLLTSHLWAAQPHSPAKPVNAA